VPAGQFQSPRQAGQRCRIPVRSELRRAEERAPTAVTSAGSIRGSAARSCGVRPVSNSRSASPSSQSAASPVGDTRGGAVAELDGRPVVVSGGVDKTVRIWDLATGSPVGDPFAGQAGYVTAVASQKRQGLVQTHSPVQICVGAGKIATISEIHSEGNGDLRWQRIAAPEVSGIILALALPSKRVLIVGAELGIIVFDFPGDPSPVSSA